MVGNFEAISLAPEPADRRTSEIAGDLVSGCKIKAHWGLHLIDVNLVMGNLLDLITSQGEVWRRAHR